MNQMENEQTYNDDLLELDKNYSRDKIDIDINIDINLENPDSNEKNNPYLNNNQNGQSV
jgi:hypothetical protein